MYRTKYNRDGTVTVWDVFRQEWIRTASPSNELLGTLMPEERERVLRHVEDEEEDDLAALAAQTPVEDGGLWPLSPITGAPLCAGCGKSATRAEYYSPEKVIAFFCEECEECDCDDGPSPIKRWAGDPHSPQIVAALKEIAAYGVHPDTARLMLRYLRTQVNPFLSRT